MNQAQYNKATKTLDDLGEVYLYSENGNGRSKTIYWRDGEYFDYSELLGAIARRQSRLSRRSSRVAR